jgi:hypothetical protein
MNTFKFIKLGVATSAVLLAGLTAASAATVTISTFAGAAYQTVNGIREDTGTRGRDLVGATVHAAYSDGTEEDLTFSEILPYVGGVSGIGFNLFLGSMPVTLSASQRLSSLAFDLVPANSLFDISTANDGRPGDTPTSKRGYPFLIESASPDLSGVIAVTYSGIVNLAGRDAVGDLYTTMLLDFTGLTGGGFLGDMVWRTDMDTLRDAGDLAPVPLPAGLPLLAVGLAGFGLIGAHRKRS